MLIRLGLMARRRSTSQHPADLVPLSNITVTATHPEGRVTTFEATVRLDTPVEVEYYRHGGILQTVLRNLAQS
ncbi:MAG: hypothetical protein Ct9H90mP16_19080 [Candidatus Poseidoniales archaeon]|nr:MAG: hypothetical protein Ct9H90mP16_19080 [Candidatus Poseidoniales archaeon]